MSAPSAVPVEVPAARPRSAGSRRAPKSARRSKEQEVLDVAAEYFLRHGYQGTSVTAMARRARISKESIYRYFNGKKQLFEAVIDRELAEYRQRLHQLESTYRGMETRDALLNFAETVLGIITSDRTLALRRLIFAESARVPDAGEQYWRIGPQNAFRNLEKIFRSHGSTRDFDPKALSHYFVALLSGKIMLERACGVVPAPTRVQIRDMSTRIVDDFMRAFLED